MPGSPREAPRIVHVCSPPRRVARRACRPPLPRSSDSTVPLPVSIVSPARPRTDCSGSGDRIIRTSPLRVRARASIVPLVRWASAPGFQPSRDAIQPRNSTPVIVDSGWWRSSTLEIVGSCRRSRAGSKAAATRSRQGVERSQARSTT